MATQKWSKDGREAGLDGPRTGDSDVLRTHYTELARYLVSYLAKALPDLRATSRSKLTRLTIQQFHELSTDVYDELVRRNDEGGVPFLLVNDMFHPKRNQARQKLSTLPPTRFEDLCGDVHFELLRRFPEFEEAVPQIEASSERTQYIELGKYLVSYLAKLPPGSRTMARTKLTRLTRQQFQELSTDVYDELLRRNNENPVLVPFLPIKEEFHPKRNYARQKLALLPIARFEDLCGDVHFELSRLFPEVKEDVLR